MGVRSWGVNNRPAPRLVQVAVLLAVALPAAVLGVAAALAADILTVNWPTGGES